MDLEPWMGQLGIGAASVALYLTLGRSYIRSVSARVKEVREQQEAAMTELKASWEARLTDVRTQAQAWEAAHNRREAEAKELTAALQRVESVMDQNIQILKAIREGTHA